MKHGSNVPFIGDSETVAAKSHFNRWLYVYAFVFLLPVLVCSCKSPFGGPRYSIPKESSARNQSQIAELQYRRARQTIDPKLRTDEFQKAIEAVDAVAANFPDDRVYTPPSRLLKGQIYYEMEDYRRASAEFRNVTRLYPDIEDVHASALFGLGNALYQLKRDREGKEYFRQLIDTYSETKNPVVRELVAKGQKKYREIR